MRFTGALGAISGRLKLGPAACTVLLALAVPAAAMERNVTAAAPAGIFDERTVELPTRLSPGDAAVYRYIFALQEQGEWAAADREIKRVRDKALMGHVLAQRYLHAEYRSSYQELAAWLAQYHDHPDAAAIYKTALRKGRAAGLKQPTGDSVPGHWIVDDLGPPPDPPPPPGRRLSGPAAGQAAALKKQIRATLRAGHLAAAERLLGRESSQHLLSDGEVDHIKAQIAAGWFAQGDDRKALELAGQAAARSGQRVPRARWIAGLAQFKRERFAEAARHFEALANTPKGEPWDIAAGGFWAARSHARARRFEAVNTWLHRAAEHPRTFYGLLAIRQLGVDTPFLWDPPTISAYEFEAIARIPAGARAFALIQVGENGRADAELRRVFLSAKPAQMRTLLAIAMHANLPGLSIRLGRQLAALDGRRNDGALYPIPPWTPTTGYQVDRALLFAFMRQESQFNAKAVSHAGARGLMQLMPRTAALLDGKSFRGRDQLLLDPVYNVTLGQRYIVQLLQDPAVQGDLIRLAAAYNGGPGNLARWTRKQDARGGEDDALLFIESLPSPETRHFITRILYSYWMYSERLGLPTPSLDDIAAGRWPTYIALDAISRGTRRNAENR